MAVDWTGYRLAPDLSGLAQGIAAYGANKQQAAQFQQEMDYKNRALANEQAKLGRGAQYARDIKQLPFVLGERDEQGNKKTLYTAYESYSRSNPEDVVRYYVDETTGARIPAESMAGAKLEPTTLDLWNAEAKTTAKAAEAKAVGEVEVGIEGKKLAAKQQVKLATEASIAKAVEQAKAEGKALGEDAYVYGDLDARMPILYDTVARLGKLSKTATYTTFGKGKDEVIKQLGFTTTEGADARGNYIAIIDNEVLPLLRSTFGAAFTVEEGNRLRNTLGDPDSSPSQKQATLDAFIKSKENQVRMLGSKLGFNPKNIAPQTAPAQGAQPNVIDFGSLK